MSNDTNTNYPPNDSTDQYSPCDDWTISLANLSTAIEEARNNGVTMEEAIEEVVHIYKV